MEQVYWMTSAIVLYMIIGEVNRVLPNIRFRSPVRER